MSSSISGLFLVALMLTEKSYTETWGWLDLLFMIPPVVMNPMKRMGNKMARTRPTQAGPGKSRRPKEGKRTGSCGEVVVVEGRSVYETDGLEGGLPIWSRGRTWEGGKESDR